jgi:hypothetical protein
VTELRSFKQRQLSIPYGVASTLVHGSMRFDGLQAPPEADRAISGVLAKIDVLADPGIQGAHGDGMLSIERQGETVAFSTEEAADPRTLITSLDGVLVKAEQALGASDRAQYLSGLQRLATAPLSTPARAALDGI